MTLLPRPLLYFPLLIKETQGGSRRTLGKNGQKTINYIRKTVLEGGQGSKKQLKNIQLIAKLVAEKLSTPPLCGVREVLLRKALAGRRPHAPPRWGGGPGATSWSGRVRGGGRWGRMGDAVIGTPRVGGN